MTFVNVAKVPDGAGFRRDGEVVQGRRDVSNGIASLNRGGEHRLDQRGQAHAADQHGSCRFVAVSKPQRSHDCRNSVGVLQSHGRSASPSKTIMRIPPLSAIGIDSGPLSQWLMPRASRSCEAQSAEQTGKLRLETLEPFSRSSDSEAPTTGRTLRGARRFTLACRAAKAAAGG
jgi:hypothetical protein